MSKDYSAKKITSFPTTFISFSEFLGLCTPFFEEIPPPTYFFNENPREYPLLTNLSFARHG